MTKNHKTKKRDSSIIILLVALVLLTVLAGGGSWFLGKNFDTFIKKDFFSADKDKNVQKKIDLNLGNIIMLPPIIANLLEPEGVRIRLELAIIAAKNEEISPVLVAEISSDFLAYLNQSPLSQIKGGVGLMYLREDLLERAAIRSSGKVVQVLLLGLVIDE